MTILRILSEKESEEDTKFGIEIQQFYLQFWYNGTVHEITEDNLKDFFSIYLIGINDK